MTNEKILSIIAQAQAECTESGIYDIDKICQHVSVSLEQAGLIHDLVRDAVENCKDGEVLEYKGYNYVALDIKYCEFSNVVAHALMVRWKTFSYLYNPYYYGIAVHEGFSKLS